MSELGEGGLMVSFGIILAALSIVWKLPKEKDNNLFWIAARFMLAFASMILGLIGMYLISQGLSAASNAVVPSIQNAKTKLHLLHIFVLK